jgi:serine/threonine protein kinase
VLEDSLWGTVRYMSPEQFLPDANPHDPSLDIYSLGATLYEVVTGRPVFPRIPPVDLVRWKLTRKPARPRELDPAVPMSLEAIVLEAMENEPRLRHPSAGDLADDLERFAEGRRGHHR